MSDTINNNETTEGRNSEVTTESAGQQAPATEPVQAATERPAQSSERPAQSSERPARPDRPRGRGRFGDSSERDKDSGPSEGGVRVPRFKRKVCIFCQDKNAAADYKRPELLERFITDRGKILPRRVTGTCARHQRIIAREIKRARAIALLPFVEQ